MCDDSRHSGPRCKESFRNKIIQKLWTDKKYDVFWREGTKYVHDSNVPIPMKANILYDLLICARYEDDDEKVIQLAPLVMEIVKHCCQNFSVSKMTSIVQGSLEELGHYEEAIEFYKKEIEIGMKKGVPDWRVASRLVFGRYHSNDTYIHEIHEMGRQQK